MEEIEQIIVTAIEVSWVDDPDTVWSVDPVTWDTSISAVEADLRDADIDWSKDELDRVWAGARKLWEIGRFASGIKPTMAECFASAMVMERG